MSSDSDEDIGLRLQKMTNKYQGDKIESTALLNDSNEIDEIFQKTQTRNERESSPLDLDELPGPSVSEIPEELPELKLNNRPKRVTRASARKRNTDEVLTEGMPLSSRKKSKNSTVTPKSCNNDVSNIDNENNTTITAVTGHGRGRGRGRGRGKKNQSNTESNINPTGTVSTSSLSTIASTCEAGTNTDFSINPTDTVNISTLRMNTLTSNTDTNTDSSCMSSPTRNLNTSSRRGSRGGRSNRRNRRGWVWRQRSPRGGRRPNNLSVMAEFMAALAPAYGGHTYVIGDAEDVADASRGQALFSNQKKTNDIVEVEDNNENNDSLDDNEELSVKVHWQNYKYEIFKIRRYQKLTQIFDYFAQKENVGYDKLLLMYNDKIIKPTDTPDSINYNIAKKIEGGTLENSVAPIMINDEDNQQIKDGIKIKFQCQHLKKPFEIAVRPDDKFSVGMTKCAEHLEKPLSMLRFEFDGDVISGKSTARELELEGGECIDVKVAS